MITNTEVAGVFRELADLLVKKHENWFKIRAYRKVADEIEKLPVDMHSMAEENRLREIPGVGEAIELKIQEILASGKLALIGRLKEELGGPQIGPKPEQ